MIHELTILRYRKLQDRDCNTLANHFFRRIVSPFFVLLCSFLLQTYFIFPIEQHYRDDQLTSIVSLIFIPHGVKVLMVMIYGVFSLPAIFGAQIVNGILLNGTFQWLEIYGAFAGTACIGLPLILHNLSMNKPLHSSPMFDKTFSFNIFWLFLSWAIISSFLNSLLHTLLFGFPTDNLPWLFLFGDVFGSIVFCLLCLCILRVVKLTWRF